MPKGKYNRKPKKIDVPKVEPPNTNIVEGYSPGGVKLVESTYRPRMMVLCISKRYYSDGSVDESVETYNTHR